jgi:hypothetical protein
LSEVNARYVKYADLLARSQKRYGEYLEKQKDVSELLTLISNVERTFDPVSWLC